MNNRLFKGKQKKVGIITFWQSKDNYGQLLQHYALQFFLTKIGYDPFLIRFMPTPIGTHMNLWKLLINIVKVYPIMRYVYRITCKRVEDNNLKWLEEKNKLRDFELFKKEYIQSSDKIYFSIKDLRDESPKADYYIVGSDQVWCMLLNSENNKGYFLDFGDEGTKRIAYAASFGREDYPSSLKPILSKMLKHFNSISVREDSGVKICAEVGCEATKVLDPTFLLSRLEYLKISSNIKCDRFCFIYSINVTKKTELFWKEISYYSEKNNLKPLIVISSGHFPARKVLGEYDYIFPTIPEWLYYIDNAEFVVTPSFHGIAFSLIMNTNFIYIPLEGEHSKGNDRVFSLLNMLGLNSKICRVGKNFEECLNSPINWENVNKILNKQKLLSIKFIKDALL